MSDISAFCLGVVFMAEKRKKVLFEITAGDVEASIGCSFYFPPGFRFTRFDEPLRPDSGAVILDDDMTVEDELKSMGYSGCYREMHDGPITRIVPLDRYGRHEYVR